MAGLFVRNVVNVGVVMIAPNRWKNAKSGKTMMIGKVTMYYANAFLPKVLSCHFTTPVSLGNQYHNKSAAGLPCTEADLSCSIAGG